jgi:hypothetical protein
MNVRRWLHACLDEIRHLCWCVIGLTISLLGWFTAGQLFWWVYRETWVGSRFFRASGIPPLLEHVNHSSPWSVTGTIMTTTLPWILVGVLGAYVLGLGSLLSTRTRVFLVAYVASYWLAPAVLGSASAHGHWLVTLVCYGVGVPSCRLASWLAGGMHSGCQWLWYRYMG